MSELLTAPEVARRLRLSVPYIYSLAAAGLIPCVRFGERAIRFPADEVDEWLRQRIERPITDDDRPAERD